MVAVRLSRRRAISLVETVTSVATVVALSAAIVIPALVGANRRSQATLCASRISQLLKATMIYSDDFRETPPFLGRGWEDCDQADKDEWPVGSRKTVGDWKSLETWLMPRMPDHWLKAQGDWGDLGSPQVGTLFVYTRFENLYRCPSFERIGNRTTTQPKGKSQQAFNYTRTWLGRKWLVPGEKALEPGSPYHFKSDLGGPGPILKVSQIYAPGKLPMMMDEHWRRHVAAPVDEFNPPGKRLTGGGWMAADCMFYPLGDEISHCHGRPMKRRADKGDPQNAAAGRGSIAYSDGHVTLEFEPVTDKVKLAPSSPGFDKLLNALKHQLYAQRGIQTKLLGR